MKANILTLNKSQAVAYMARTKRPGQVYLKKFDVDVVFRKGKLADPQIGKVRYREDDRPNKSFNKRTGREVEKKNDIVTYKMPGKDDLYVLAKSGGVSLFDGMSNKVKLGNKDRWWIITKDAKLEDGLIIAKDVFKDSEGNTHYSIESEWDMLLSEYIEKLEKLKKYMKEA